MEKKRGTEDEKRAKYRFKQRVGKINRQRDNINMMKWKERKKERLFRRKKGDKGKEMEYIGAVKENK